MRKFLEKHSKLIESVAICLYICIGSLSMALAVQSDSYLNSALGGILLASGISKIVMYYGREKKRSLSPIYIICAIIKTAFGIFFLFARFLQSDVICLIWGCLDIGTGIAEGVFDSAKIKNEWGAITETILDIGDIVLGVLLVLHLEEGLQLHLLYLSIYFLISSMALVMKLGIDQDAEKNTN